MFLSEETWNIVRGRIDHHGIARRALQYIMEQRILVKELGIPTGGPTKLYTDNLATLQGT